MGDGSVLTGPKTMNVTKPFSQIPMWHRKGGIVITTGSQALRINDQDWSELTLEAFPARGPSESIRRLSAEGKTTLVKLTTHESGGVRVEIVTPQAGRSRAWRLRIHLARDQRIESSFLDGVEFLRDTVQHIKPTMDCTAVFPFDGVGSAPACKAGPVAEFFIPASAAHRIVELT